MTVFVTKRDEEVRGWRSSIRMSLIIFTLPQMIKSRSME
jgi:hypothetical protein